MAPHAAQRASLHEDGGADAWAVVDSVAFDIENQHTGCLVLKEV